MVLSSRCIRLGAGKGGEMMKLIGVFFLLIIFISPIYAQDLFDQAEIEFDVDYIDIDKVKLLGSKNKGQVIAVWMKSGSVLTKTLSKSKIKYSNREDREDREDREFDNGGYPGNIINYEKPLISELREKSDEELVSKIYNLLDEEWINQRTTYLLFDVEFALKLNGGRNSEYVQLAMDIINYNLEHGMNIRQLQGEKDMLKQFAEEDEQLTKMANDFLEEKGFNQ